MHHFVMKSAPQKLGAGALVALVALGIFTTPTVAADKPKPAPAKPAPATQHEPWVTAMLALVNEQRAKAGVGRLILCAPLMRASGAYAQAMAQTGHFEHIGTDGSEPWDRGRAQGYRYRTYAENIAAGQSSVAMVMSSWVDSPGHFANLINGSFTHLGVGHATAPTGEYSDYWVQNFGAGGKC